MFSFQSKFTRDKFVEFGFDVNKTMILPNPVECENIVPSYNHKKFILYFGRIERNKGVFTLVNALSIIKDVELKIIGDGPDLGELKCLADKLNLKNISFLGALWKDELQKVLNCCAFVIVPSEWYEPSPYAILQSFAAGKTVIGAKIGGINDLIIEGKNGLLFDFGNVVQLAEKIKLLLNDEDKIFEFGKNARKLIEEQHSPKVFYDETVRVYKKLKNQNL